MKHNHFVVFTSFFFKVHLNFCPQFISVNLLKRFRFYYLLLGGFNEHLKAFILPFFFFLTNHYLVSRAGVFALGQFLLVVNLVCFLNSNMNVIVEVRDIYHNATTLAMTVNKPAILYYCSSYFSLVGFISIASVISLSCQVQFEYFRTSQWCRV